MGILIVFFGNEKLATGISPVKPVIFDAVLDAGFEIEQHVTGKLTELRPHKSVIAVLAAYGHIIPKSVLDQFPLGIINVHPSLLPLYRGPTPIEQAILDGASKTGVSIMHLTAGMDEGPIYKQKTVRLSGDESKAELTERLQHLGSQLLTEVLQAIFSNQIKPHNQPHPDRATYSRKLAKADGDIDWTKSAQQIEREIRAYAGWPGSHTILAGKEVIINAAHVVDKTGKPGKTMVEDKQLLVYAGQKALNIDKLKPAGKTEMTSQAFLAGYKIKGR
ncbi:MAG TPA: methionyl-tRNA formyltransferase [Candidatus Saccharimonadales bacterium]|nr:methionyl-tRNA formyltransferase [Candidatus Saccharimonadales bacterium]